MNTTQLLQTIEQAANDTTGINQFSHLDIYETINTNEIKYAVVCMVLQSMTVKENYVSYTFQFYAADRLNNAENNRNLIIAQLFDIAENYVANLRNADGVLDVEFDRQYNNSEYRTMDVVSCIYGTLTIDVESNFNAC